MSTTAALRRRRDTAANWTAANPTPLAGQLCFETDTDRAKFGDGATAWNSLPYLFEAPPSVSWQAVASDITMGPGYYLVSGLRALSLPASVTAGLNFVVHAVDDTVSILRNGNTITYMGVDVADDVSIAPGETITLASRAGNEVEIV